MTTRKLSRNKALADYLELKAQRAAINLPAPGEENTRKYDPNAPLELDTMAFLSPDLGGMTTAAPAAGLTSQEFFVRVRAKGRTYYFRHTEYYSDEALGSCLRVFSRIGCTSREVDRVRDASTVMRSSSLPLSLQRKAAVTYGDKEKLARKARRGLLTLREHFEIVCNSLWPFGKK